MACCTNEIATGWGRLLKDKAKAFTGSSSKKTKPSTPAGVFVSIINAYRTNLIVISH
jgi:hypothetical protein